MYRYVISFECDAGKIGQNFFYFEDFGPQNIRVAETVGTTSKIMWDQAPSCYKIQGFHFIYSNGKQDLKVKYTI